MVETEVLIAAGGGFVIGFVVGWAVGIGRKEKKGKKQKGQGEQLKADALAFLNQCDPTQVFDVHVARYDVERGMMVGVMHHVDDMVAGLKEQGELTSILRLVILEYDGEGERLTRHDDLCRHFLKIHQDRPFLPVFFDPPSMKLYLRFLLRARALDGQSGASKESALDALEQEIVGHVTQMMAAILPERTETLSKTLETLLNRLERVVEEMAQQDRERLSASLQGSATPTR